MASVVVAAVGLVAAACGSAPPGEPTVAGTLPDGSPLMIPADAGYRAVDVLQVLRLLERHQRRSALTDLIVARAGDAEVRELARRVAADAEELDVTAHELLERWGQVPVAPPPGDPDVAASERRRARLEALEGDAFDRAALEALLEELQLDVATGTLARNQGRDDDARRLGADAAAAAQERLERVREVLGANAAR